MSLSLSRSVPFCVLLLVGAWSVAAPRASARPAHKKAVADYFGAALPPKLNACTTCHLAAKPTDAEHAHNAFGKRLASVRDELRQNGKKTDILSRVFAIADEDSDGDGVSNVLELLSGHNPGDPQDRPTAAEVAAARNAWAELLKSKEAYAWRPFDRVRQPIIPGDTRPARPGNPIDAFLAVEYAKHGLTPRPEAAKYVLLRRLYLDLIGLPPTRAEIQAFLADSSPDAYEKAVDRLLASPRYGERWGRHWMDVWRYSDWAGFGEEVRESHRHIWHWRDWIVESLNADKGYDRMIVEMLAGDEIAPTDPDTLRATGFLVRPWFIFNRNTWLDSTVEHTAKAFLGITLNCARCHEHKYDPIEQTEYYRFRAFFEPYHIRIDRVPGEPDLNKAGIPRVFDANLDAKTHLFVRGDEASPDTSKALEPAVPVALGGTAMQIHPVRLPLAAYRPDKRRFVIRQRTFDPMVEYRNACGS
jgi:cytochrome c553